MNFIQSAVGQGVTGICVLLALNICLQVGKMYLAHLQKKQQALEASVEKLKLDMMRSFTAIKVLAGDEWPEIREEVLKDRKWSP